MPPDDPAAYALAPHPQGPGHKGVGTVEGTGYLDAIKAWDTANRAEREAEAQTDKADLGTPGHGPASPYPGAAPKGRRGEIQTLFDGNLKAEQGFLLTLDQTVELGLINSREYQS